MNSDREEISIRPPIVADAMAVAENVRASIDELRPWMSWANEQYDDALATKWINGELGDPHRFVIVEPGGAIVGACGLNGLDELNRRANLGYWIRSDRTRRGYATAATQLLAQFGFDVVGLHRMEIVMSTRNVASRRVAERAGAHHEGIARGRLLLHGEFHDAHVFGLTSEHGAAGGGQLRW